MTKLATRTITVVVLVPLIFAIILLAPWYHYLAINLVCILASVLGALETANFLSVRGLPLEPALAAVLGGLLPLATYLEVSGVAPAGLLMGVLIIAISLILVREVVAGSQAKFERILPRIAASVTTILYPGLFLTYIVRITNLALGGLSLVVFLLVVFANDVAAYLAGSLWGRGSRGVLPISPNKSLVGFVSGLAAALLMAVGCFLVFPAVFGGSLLLALAIGLGIGILTILGDLVESAMKRSSSLKDSGTVVPGRGGILDSIDSVVFASPLCFYLFSLASGALASGAIASGASR